MADELKKEKTAVDVGIDILGQIAAIEAMCKGEKIGDPVVSGNPSVEDIMSNFDETLKDADEAAKANFNKSTKHN